VVMWRRGNVAMWYVAFEARGGMGGDVATWYVAFEVRGDG